MEALKPPTDLCPLIPTIPRSFAKERNSSWRASYPGAITQQTFNQIEVYNLLLKVDYLVVSNGMQHYCCKMDYERCSYAFLKDIPDYAVL